MMHGRKDTHDSANFIPNKSRGLVGVIVIHVEIIMEAPGKDR